MSFAFKKYLLPIIFSSCVINISYAQIDENHTISSIANTIKYTNDPASDIWPGYKINFPVIIDINDKNHFYAFQFIPKNTAWQKIILDGQEVNYLNKDIYNIGNIFDASILMGSTDSYLMDDQLVYVQALSSVSDEYNKWDKYAGIYYTIRSQFELYLFHNFNKRFLSPYDGFNKGDNVKLTYLEMAILQDYLRSGYDEEKLKNAIAVHQYRYKFLSRDNQSFEEFNQIIGGISNYIAFKSMNLNQADMLQEMKFYLSTQDILPDPSVHFSIIEDVRDTASNFFFAIYGNELDIKKVNWKKNVFESRMSPAGQLIQYWQMSDKEMVERFQAAMAIPAYHYAEISYNVDQNLEKFNRDVNKYQRMYVNLPGIELNIQPESMSSFWAFENGSDVLEINSQLDLLIDAVIFITDLTGEHYISCQTLPIVYMNDKNTRFKIDEATLFNIDGRNFSAAKIIRNGKKVIFNDLTLKYKNVEIYLKNVSGTIEPSEGKLSLKFFINNKLTKPAFILPKKRYRFTNIQKFNQMKLHLK